MLKSNDLNEMALTRFIELYELRYNQTITVPELFKLKEIVQITHCKDGSQGRLIKLTAKNYQSNLETEMRKLSQTPYCPFHSSIHIDRYVSSSNGEALTHTNSCLPNVIVSLRTFKSAVHKLLNDHGGQMPLLSFMDCYKCCIILTESHNNHRSLNSNDSKFSIIFLLNKLVNKIKKVLLK